GLQQGDLQRTPLRRRQRRTNLARHVLEQIAQSREREDRLRLRRLAREYAEPALFCPTRHLTPYRRLPDPRLALAEQHAKPPARPIEESAGESELALPANHRRHSERSLGDRSAKGKRHRLVVVCWPAVLRRQLGAAPRPRRGASKASVKPGLAGRPS